MRHVATLLLGMLSASTVGAADVYVTTDASGQKIYTDIPQTLPARKVETYDQDPGPATAAKDDSSGTKRYGQKVDASPGASARQTIPAAAEERAARCAEVRQRYEMLMNSLSVYTLGPNGEQNFLTAAQMSEERVKAKQFLDSFCTDR